MAQFGLRPGGLECDDDGLRLAGLALLKSEIPPSGRRRWRPAPLPEVERALSCAYGHPIDAAANIKGLQVVASALNAGELARAQIAAVLLRLPDPADASVYDTVWSSMARNDTESAPEAKDWDPDKHPRVDGPPNPGWFAPKDGPAEDDTTNSVPKPAASSSDGHAPAGTVMAYVEPHDLAGIQNMGGFTILHLRGKIYGERRTKDS